MVDTLVREGGPERCLLCNSQTSTAQTVPVYLTGGQEVPFHLLSLRSGFGTMSFYQDPKAEYSMAAGDGAAGAAWAAPLFMANFLRA